MKLFKAVPWFLILAVLRVLFEHYSRLSQQDRMRLSQIIKETHGLPHKFSPEHKQTVMEVAAKVDKALLGQDLVELAVPRVLARATKKKKAKQNPGQ